MPEGALLLDCRRQEHMGSERMEPSPRGRFFKELRREWDEGIQTQSEDSQTGRFSLAGRRLSTLAGEGETKIMQLPSSQFKDAGSTATPPRPGHCHHLTPGLQGHTLDTHKSCTWVMSPKGWRPGRCEFIPKTRLVET